MHFDDRYEWFWSYERRQKTSPPPVIEPNTLRLEFDMDVVKATKADLNKNDILRAYEAMVWDMIVTRGLRKD